MNKDKLLQFLLKARTKTYAGDEGEVESAFEDSKQLEYKKDDYLYRDIYYTGKKKFMGLETIYYQQQPVWSMSYYGSCTEEPEEIYDFLKEALLKNWKDARTWKEVEWEKGDYKYLCKPDFEGSIEEMAGMEQIHKKDEQVYSFFYGGGLIS